MDTIEQNKTTDRQPWPIKMLLFIGSLFIAAIILALLLKRQILIPKKNAYCLQ